MDIGLGDKVRYTSNGRPWLRDRDGVVLRFSETGRSALVDFPASDTRSAYSEWIGVSALEVAKPAKSAVSDVRQKVQDEIRILEKVISEARAKISKLNYANKALKDLGL